MQRDHELEKVVLCKMSRLSPNVVDEIVRTCLDEFIKIPKTGKPIENEWTVLSCIVQLDTESGLFEVVSLGTGSKCIGASKMSSEGDILNDSHAEVIARRGFLLYLYENIDHTFENKYSVFKIEEKRLKLKDNIEFIFYSSQLPCGDACIIPKSGDTDDFGTVLNFEEKLEIEEEGSYPCTPKRFKYDLKASPSIPLNTNSNLEHIIDETNATMNSKNKSNCTKPDQSKLEADIHRTGAKCLPNSEQDTKKPGLEYHCLGKVRTKPGRGDRTLSVSCSDKIARWIHLGIEGALLNLLCGRICIKHYIFGAGVPFSKESLNRAFLKRECNFQVELKNVPEIYQSTVKFLHLKNDKNLRSAPGSIIWIKSRNTEVAVQGKKLGVTKKNLKLPHHFLCITKYKLYEKFIKILQKHKEHFDNIECGSVQNVPYNIMKRKSQDYAKKWLRIKDEFFKSWTVKPDMWNFTVAK